MVSVCIDMMFRHLDFYDRIAAVKKCGADAVEFWRWSDKDVKKIKDSGIRIAAFDLDSSDERLSRDLSRGILNDGRVEEFITALKESIPIYHELCASAMTVYIGENAPYNEKNIYDCLRTALPLLEKNSINLLLEPVNDIDRGGYSMPYTAPLFELLRRIDSPRIKLLYDIYHQNMMGDFSINVIKDNINHIGHFHVADAPGRHEPGTGNIDYVNILKEISTLEYNGYIGLKYVATKRDDKTLGFLKIIER